MRMSKLTWKMMGLAAVVAGGAQLAMMGAAGAVVMPMPAQSASSEISQAGSQTLQVESRSRNRYTRHHQRQRYNRGRHGTRYGYRRNGYGYHYGNYWYASPWWLVPSVAITIPTHVYGGNGHVNWCLRHYRSYNPRTDMFMGYDGRHHRCVRR